MTSPRQNLLTRTKVAANTLLIIGAAGSVLTAPAAYANSFVLDFETDSQGNILDANHLDGHGTGPRTDIGDLWKDIGITITGDPNWGNAPLGLFNTNCIPVDARNISSDFDPATTPLCGVNRNLGDNDLATGKGSYDGISYLSKPQGNALIFEENPGNGTPDDTSKGGTIEFHFDLVNQLDEVILGSAFFIDDSRGKIVVTYEDNENPWERRFKVDGENEVRKFALGARDETRNAKKLAITFDGSGAIGGLKFRSFKEKPASVPEPTGLLGLAIAGGFGARTLRKRQLEER